MIELCRSKRTMWKLLPYVQWHTYGEIRMEECHHSEISIGTHEQVCLSPFVPASELRLLGAAHSELYIMCPSNGLATHARLPRLERRLIPQVRNNTWGEWKREHLREPVCSLPCVVPVGSTWFLCVRVLCKVLCLEKYSGDEGRKRRKFT